MSQDTPPKYIISAESDHEQGDGKADDDGKTKNLQAAFSTVRNNDNLGINRLRAINSSHLSHIGCFMVSDPGSVTALGLSPLHATLPSRSVR